MYLIRHQTHHDRCSLHANLHAAKDEANMRTQYTQQAHEVVNEDGRVIYIAVPLQDPEVGRGYGVAKDTFWGHLRGLLWRLGGSQ